MERHSLILMIFILWGSLLSCTQPRLAQSPLPTPAEQKGVVAPQPSPTPTPNLTVDEALAKAVEAVEIEGEYWLQPENTKLIQYSVPTKATKPHYILVWKVVITARCPLGHWYVNVDAETGQVISFYNGLILEKPSDKCPTPHPLPRLTPIPAPVNEPTPPNPYLQQLGIFEPGTVSEVITNTTPLLFDIPLKGDLLPRSEIDWFTVELTPERVVSDIYATFTNPNAEAILLIYNKDKQLITWEDNCLKRDITICFNVSPKGRTGRHYVGLWLKSAGENSNALAEDYTIQLVPLKQ